MMQINMRASRIILILLVSAFFLLGVNPVFAGLGVSPSQMIVKNLLKTTSLERSFILSRSDPKEELYFTATMEGATKDWTVLDKGTEFTMPAGEKRFPITIIVNVPKDAANGEYKGGVRLVSSSNSDRSAKNGTSTALAVLIQTSLTVTDKQILEYDIVSIGINDIEEGSPLDIPITINNTGNVRARPTKVRVEVYNIFNKELLESQDVIEMGSVAPFTTGDIVISAPTKLKIGQYYTRVLAYKDETLLKAEDLVFGIVEVGSLNKRGNLKEIIYNKKADIGEIVKITGVFENNGQSDYSAKFVVEIFKGGKLIKLTESDLVNIGKGKTENLFVYFTPDSSGTYSIKANVAYSGGKTPVKEFKISVGNNLAVMGTILAILVILIIILVIFLKKKIRYDLKKRRKKYKNYHDKYFST